MSLEAVPTERNDVPMTKWYELAKARMKDLRITQENLAEHLGVTQGAVAHWMSGRREPSLEVIATVLKFVGLPPMSMATQSVVAGDEAVSGAAMAELANLRARPEEILIPQYDVRAAMGHGQVPADYIEVVRNLVVRDDMLRKKGISYSSAKELAVVTGWGQSMEGTINDLDPVVVDRGIQQFVGEGIYLITWEKLLYIKRLQMQDQQHMWLISDNKHYERQTARVEDVTIHAKVLLIWSAVKA